VKFRVDELEKDKAYLEELVANFKDQLVMVEYEKKYFTSRKAKFDNRIKAVEARKESNMLKSLREDVAKKKFAQQSQHKKATFFPP
jgi:hypothetical protein